MQLEVKYVAVVNIPDELYVEIEKRVKESEDFSSVDEYVTFVLEELLKDEDEDVEYTMSEEEEEVVKERLRELGYL